MRRRRADKRDKSVDLRFGSREVGLLISKVMTSGKKQVAERVVYGALDTVQKQANQEPLEVLRTALDNVRPTRGLRLHRLGHGRRRRDHDRQVWPLRPEDRHRFGE